jgi:hypothetical protein
VENITAVELPVVKFSMALHEHSYHGKQPNSNEKPVSIPFLNEEKAKWACGVRTACSNAKGIIPVERPVIKYSAGLPEHSFHPDEPDSDDKFVPIPLLNEVGTLPLVMILRSIYHLKQSLVIDSSKLPVCGNRELMYPSHNLSDSRRSSYRAPISSRTCKLNQIFEAKLRNYYNLNLAVAL